MMLPSAPQGRPGWRLVRLERVRDHSGNVAGQVEYRLWAGARCLGQLAPPQDRDGTWVLVSQQDQPGGQIEWRFVDRAGACSVLRAWRRLLRGGVVPQ